MIAPERILARLQSLPTLPVVVMRLMALLKDDKASASDFEKAVRPDPALTTNLLRAANSAAFGAGSPCTTVAQAVARVGTRRVFEVAASAAFQRVIPQQLAGYEMPAATFWLHSVAVAVLSERLAREARLPSASSAFTAGLLHDLGKLVIGDFLAEEGRRWRAQLAQGELTFIAAEHAALGTDHALVGLEVARRWNLPQEVMAVARWHHQPAAEGQEHGELVAVVHLANALAHSFGYGTDTGELHRNLSPSAVERLGLDPARIERVVCDSFDEIFASAVLLGEGSKGP